MTDDIYLSMNNNSNHLQFRLKSNNLEGKRGKWWKHWAWYCSKFSLVDQPWTNVSDDIKWKWIVDSIRLHQTWILNRINLEEERGDERNSFFLSFSSFWVRKWKIHLVTSRWEARTNPNWNQGEWRKTNDATFHYFFTLNVNKNEIEEFFFEFFFFSHFQ